MTYLLDTNIVSQGPKAKPDPAVVTFLANLSLQELAISAITVQEIRYGIESMDAGRRRREIEHWLEKDLLTRFRGRILPVDSAVADRCGRIVAAARKRKHNSELADALIAATAAVHGLAIVTLNRRDFERLDAQVATL